MCKPYTPRIYIYIFYISYTNINQKIISIFSYAEGDMTNVIPDIR